MLRASDSERGGRRSPRVGAVLDLRQVRLYNTNNNNISMITVIILIISILLRVWTFICQYRAKKQSSAIGFARFSKINPGTYVLFACVCVLAASIISIINVISIISIITIIVVVVVVMLSSSSSSLSLSSRGPPTRRDRQPDVNTPLLARGAGAREGEDL